MFEWWSFGPTPKLPLRRKEKTQLALSFFSPVENALSMESFGDAYTIFDEQTDRGITFVGATSYTARSVRDRPVNSGTAHYLRLSQQRQQRAGYSFGLLAGHKMSCARHYLTPDEHREYRSLRG
jgi:hypothetical protein